MQSFRRSRIGTLKQFNFVLQPVVPAAAPAGSVVTPVQTPTSHTPTQTTTASSASTPVTPGATATSSAGTPGAAKSWSSVTMGEPVKRIVGHKSPNFQEEFPTLASSGSDTDKKDGAEKKEGETTKEPQYGPGPSLRPQSKCF